MPVSERTEIGSAGVDSDLQSPSHAYEAAYLLACIDEFVQDAQQRLAKKGAWFIGGAGVCMVGIMVTIGYAIVIGRETIAADTISADDRQGLRELILYVFRGFAFSALVFALVKSLLAFARSFMHEGTRLLDQRHSLRFGRLYMYTFRESFTFAELKEAFQWNREPRTSFLDLKPEVLTEGILNQLAKSLSKGVELGATAVTKARSHTVEDSGDTSQS